MVSCVLCMFVLIVFYMCMVCFLLCVVLCLLYVCMCLGGSVVNCDFSVLRLLWGIVCCVLCV